MTGPTAVPHAHYALNIHIEFVGALPAEYNRAAPEVTPAQFAAVDAVKDTLRAAGFAVTETGHGSLRIGTVDVDPLEVDIQRPCGGEHYKPLDLLPAKWEPNALAELDEPLKGGLS